MYEFAYLNYHYLFVLLFVYRLQYDISLLINVFFQYCFQYELKMKKKATSEKEHAAKYLAKIKTDPLKYKFHKKKERERWERNSREQENITEQEKRCKRKYWREGQRKHLACKCIESTVSITTPTFTMSASEIIINFTTNIGKKLAGRSKIQRKYRMIDFATNAAGLEKKQLCRILHSYTASHVYNRKVHQYLAFKYIHSIVKFFERDDISRITTSKLDVISRKGVTKQ